MIAGDHAGVEVFFDRRARGLHRLLGENLRHRRGIIRFVKTAPALLRDELHHVLRRACTEADAGNRHPLRAHVADESGEVVFRRLPV